MTRPDIAAQHGPRDAAPGAGLDGQRVIRRKPRRAALRLHHHREGDAGQLGEFGGGDAPEVDGLVSHRTEVWTFVPYPSSPDVPHGQEFHGAQNGHMDDQWPQRLVFRQLVDAYKKRADLTSEQLAPLLGIKPQSLHKYLYGRTKRPGRKVLIQAAGLFGCSLGELFLDTPQANIPEGLGPVDQFRFDTMVEKMNGADLTAKDRQILFEDFMTAYNRLVTLKKQIAE